MAVMNTGSETLHIDVPIADVFIDGVSNRRSQTFRLMLTASLQSDHSRKAPYYLYDLWEKQDNLDDSIVRKDKRRYGRFEGIVKGHISNVKIKPHQTRVWRLDPIWGAEEKQDQAMLSKMRRRGARYDL